MPGLEIKGLTHRYGKVAALNHLSLALDDGDIGCLLGPSGSGKTTVLACVAGLEKPSAGSILIGGEDKTRLPPEKRGVGMVFQDFALFPHLTVRQNILFGGAKANGAKPNGGAGKMATEALESLCGISAVANSYPHELSGGEAQRAALARALANAPKLLLLDEPFSRLDAALREHLMREVRAIVKESGITTLMVTHNQHEAFAIADVGGVINHGAICQWDDIYNLYHRPQCAFVAGFVGDGALIKGKLTADGGAQTQLGLLRGENKPLAAGGLAKPGDAVKILLRPDDIAAVTDGGVMAVVCERAFRGPTTLYKLRIGADGDGVETVLSEMPSHCNFAIGEGVRITAKPRHLVVFPALGDA
ncbi:MAG: ABC transporter ATP-binding protein [Gammaproteobacteria bacterium]